MTVDPKVYELAMVFVTKLLQDIDPKGQREYDFERLFDRTAQAMQQSIEAECEAIRQELQR